MSLAALIFDVDGVIVASPHEQAWREALAGITSPERLTTALYQSHVAGRPRMDGARAVLAALAIPDPGGLAERYAAAKQQRIEALIAAGRFAAFPDAIRLIAAARSLGLKTALASSSKNAAAMLRQIATPEGIALLDWFDADLSGLDLPHGKPDPEIFLRAAAALTLPPARCLVVEDAPAGIAAGVAAGMATIGVARLDDATPLRQAGATLVVTSLDEVDPDTLLSGQPAAIDPFQADPARSLTVTGFDRRTENSVEARLAIGNGFLGVRASRSVSRAALWLSWLPWLTWTSWPRTYVAGLFDAPETDPPVPALVPIGDWTRVRVIVNGETLLARDGETLTHTRTLDMKHGVLLGDWRQRTAGGNVVHIRTLRLVSQAARALGLQLLRLTIDGPPAEVTLEASFEAAGLGMRPLALDHSLGCWRTAQGTHQVAMGGDVALTLDGRTLTPATPAPLTWSWSWTAAPGQTVALRRVMGVARDGDDPAAAVRAALAAAGPWPAILAAHRAAWAARWHASDIVLTGDPAAQQALRFAAYHLISTANPEDPHVSIGARALSGDVYLGHAFWDTEIYLLPFYTLTWPEAARALLLYRHHTLPGARAKAKAGGWRGAMYAWESADSGRETTPDRVMGPAGVPVDVLSGKLEQHITGDVALAVWRYWEATGDDPFLRDAGAEILLEAARFWSSRAALEADGRHHIRDVIGPDEYHEHVDDNAFTNAIARWTIHRGLDAAAWLSAHWPAVWTDLSTRLALVPAELAAWRTVADTLVTGFDPASGLYEQFAGYFALEDVRPPPDPSVPVDVALGHEQVQRTQWVKQADVVALLALGIADIAPETARANFDYYAPRCAHGSSLSRAMHAIVAARLGGTGDAARYFADSTALDLSDAAAGASGGVHIAALGGLWQAAVFGFAGLSLTEREVRLDPRLPPAWTGLSFRVQWRGRVIRVDLNAAKATVICEAGAAVPFRFRTAAHRLEAGHPQSLDLA